MGEDSVVLHLIDKCLRKQISAGQLYMTAAD